MADESVLSPISAAEPPKVNPLKPVAPAGASTLKLAPAIKRPVTGATQSALRPTLKLPPKPGTVATAGLKLPAKPTVPGGLKLPTKPVIRKPGTGPAVSTLPPPVKSAAPAAPAAPADKPAESVAAPAPAAAVAAPVEPVKAESAAPVTVDAGGVVKLPTVEMKAVDRADVKPPAVEAPAPLDALKQVTQKLKGTTQQIPQQAILRKTGIIADASMSEAQKQAAKSKTARISLSEAIGAAPVKNENAPMKTIRIKRPVGIPTAAKSEEPAAAAETPVAETAAPEAAAATDNASASVTQRKTLKISRPGTGAVRPGGKFGVKRPSQAVTKPAEANAAAEGDAAAVPEIADIPDMPSVAPIADVADISAAQEGPAWLISLSTLVQAAASIAIGALAWFLFENTQTVYF